MVVFYYYRALNTESILIQTITINMIHFLTWVHHSNIIYGFITFQSHKTLIGKLIFMIGRLLLSLENYNVSKQYKGVLDYIFQSSSKIFILNFDLFAMFIPRLFFLHDMYNCVYMFLK